MNKRKQCLTFSVLLLASASAILATDGCRSNASTSHEAGNAEASKSAAPSAPVGGTYCLTTIEQDPSLSQPIHFSYKKSMSDGSSSDFEGDLTGDTFDSTVQEKRKATDMDREMSTVKGAAPVIIVNGFVESTRRNHAARSDPSEWMIASNGPAQAFTPWGLFIARPEVKQVGTENLAGFDAIKYSVDTSAQSQLDKLPLKMTSGLKDYTIKGAVWVDKSRQCILQYNIDYEEDEKDGTVNTTHYEGSATKK